MKEKFVYRTSRLVGFLILIAALLHVSLGFAEVLTAIKTGDVQQPRMQTTIKSVWLLSSSWLFLIGLWLLFLSKDLRQLKRRAWTQAFIIALGLTGGAAVVIVTEGLQFPALIYGLLGLILLFPLIIRVGAFGRDPRATQSSLPTKSTDRPN